MRFIYRDFAFLSPASKRAAQAAHCAQDQGYFWEYHDKIFEVTASENPAALSDDKLRQMASEIGLDADAFDRCLSSGKYIGFVEQSYQEGRNAGVSSTPTFFINGRKVEGALPFAEFEKVIEEELSKGS